MKTPKKVADLFFLLVFLFPLVGFSQLKLPIRDDFSSTKIYPDQSIWLDSNVYINSDFPSDPISIGVATFDGADKTGKPYQSLLKKSYGVADYLTSRPINLLDHSGIRYNPRDSIFLSFYYQPKGLGDAPDLADSLVLEFRVLTDTVWKHAWSVEGSGLQPFKAVIVPIVDTAYFKNNFQFRFKNYTTYSGNLDHWNLDYVVLDKGRNRNDTVMNEITWVERNPSSFLKNYQSMPWRHFVGHENTELNDLFNIRVRNNSTNFYTTFYNFEFKDNTGKITALYPGPNLSNKNAVNPNPNSYFTISGIKMPPNPFPDNGKDSASFTIEKILSNSSAVIEKQNFFNYYAYDDGTAEGGYGVTESGGKIAMQFNMTKQDTIQAVSMYFNQIKDDVSGSTFKIVIWDNLSTNHILYQSADVPPIYENTVNGFHTYKLDHPIVASGTIYVGWIQNTQLNLKLGVDRNNNISKDLMQFYTQSNGHWLSTTFDGAWMLRLVVGKTLPNVLGIGAEPNNSSTGYSVYPNPATNKIYIKNTNDPESVIDFSHLDFQLTDALGRIILVQTGGENIDISEATPGFYFLKIRDKRNHINAIHKIVVSR
jgi:hypothetical protein